MRVCTENIVQLESCWVGRGAVEIIHGIPLQRPLHGSGFSARKQTVAEQHVQLCISNKIGESPMWCQQMH
jgi:hypothetical protein